jgi:hypothetical protein
MNQLLSKKYEKSHIFVYYFVFFVGCSVKEASLCLEFLVLHAYRKRKTTTKQKVVLRIETTTKTTSELNYPRQSGEVVKVSKRKPGINHAPGDLAASFNDKVEK